MESVQRVVVLPGEEIGAINPYLHGHFAEHLGELVYPGICVPPDCPIPNTEGIRNDVVEALKSLGIPVLRWPGGCFADDYHWRDGVGPSRAHRLATCDTEQSSGGRNLAEGGWRAGVSGIELE